MGTATGGGPAISQEDRSIYQANALSKSLPDDISKSSNSFHSDYANPAYETGRNSNGVTLDSCLEELSRNWTTDSGKTMISKMQEINDSINESLNSLSAALSSVTDITVKITYTEELEDV